MSVYRVGLLAVAISLVVAALGARVASVPLLCAGAILTLCGNLRHLSQWLAAGAGLAVVGGSIALQVQRDLSGILFLVGVLIILFAPRLIGRYRERRQKAPEEMEMAGGELRSFD
jgi:hypothetical protein